MPVTGRRQADSRALVLGALVYLVKGAKHLLRVVHVEADAVVGDFEEEAGRVRAQGEADFPGVGVAVGVGQRFAGELQELGAMGEREAFRQGVVDGENQVRGGVGVR